MSNTKKSAFSFLKDALVNDIPGAEAPAPVAAAYVPAAADPGAGTRAISSKFRTALQQGIEEKQLAGFDYLKLKRFVSEQAAYIPDERTRFIAAGAMAKTMGVTKEKLVETAQFYKSVLSEEAIKFQTDMQDFTQDNIVADEAEAVRLQQSIEAKKAEVSKLNQEVTQLTNDLTTVNARLGESKHIVQTKKQDFESARAYLAQEIDADISKINLNLQ